MTETGANGELELRLSRALGAEAEEVPVRLDATNLGARWAARRRQRRLRETVAACGVLAIVAAGLGWYGGLGNRILNGVAGPIPTGTSDSMPAGLSVGRATLALTDPAKSSIEFDVKCVWSATGHVVGLSAGKQPVAGEQDTVLWQLRPGPRYELQLEREDGTVFGFTPSDPSSNYTSHVSADARSGSIAFKDLVLWSGDAATAPKRSGLFTWECPPPAVAAAAASLPSAHPDSNGAPQLWMVEKQAPAFETETGCPVQVEGGGTSLAGSCAYANWWEGLKVSANRYGTRPGQAFSLAIDGWTITHARVRAIRAVDAEALPVGASPPESQVAVLADQLGPVVKVVPPQEPGIWYVVFDVEAARDDGGYLSGQYEASVEVPR